MGWRIAVTGASGFVGQVLVDRLLRDTRVQRVLAIDLRAIGRTHPKLSHATRDICDPRIGELLTCCDALIHLAYVEARRRRSPAWAERMNVEATATVVQAAVGAGVRQVLHASSIAAYGFHADNLNRTLDEQAPRHRNDNFHYPRAKAACERWLERYAESVPDVAIVMLRASTILGPRGRRNLGWLKLPLLPYLAGPSQPVHLTHEDDVAEAFVLSLERRARGAYNVATEEPLALNQWAQHTGQLALRLPEATIGLVELAYRARLIELNPAWLREGRAFPIVVTSDKIRRELGWRPRFATTAEVLRRLASDGA